MTADTAAIRRFAGLSLATGLSVAALAAIVAVLSGSFDEEGGKVILTSIGFALASALGASGAAARLRPSETLRSLGLLTVVASAAAFVLLVVGLWADPDSWGSETVWRVFGCAGVAALAGSHACLMLGARRGSDSGLVRFLTASSLCLAAFDGIGAILPISDVVTEVGDPWGRIFAVTLVLLVLSSVLPGILRRVQAAAPRDAFASEVAEIADRIDVLNSDPGNRAPEIRAELRRLRELARSAEK